MSPVILSIRDPDIPRPAAFLASPHGRVTDDRSCRRVIRGHLGGCGPADDGVSTSPNASRASAREKR